MINPIQSIKTKVVGVTRTNKDGIDRQELLSYLTDGDILELQRDLENEHDENAVLVLDSSGKDIGFLSKQLAATVGPLLDQGQPGLAVVLNVSNSDGSEILGCNIEVLIYPPGTDISNLIGGNTQVAITDEPNRWEQRAEKLDKFSKKTDEVGKNMMGCGCLLTLLITVPIIIFLILL